MKGINYEDVERILNKSEITDEDRDVLKEIYKNFCSNQEIEMKVSNSYNYLNYIKSLNTFFLKSEKEREENLKEKETIQRLKKKKFPQKEIGKIVQTNRRRRIVKVEIGEVYYANLLLAPYGEVAFIHPVMILENIGNGKAFVVPCTSYTEYVNKAYNPFVEDEYEEPFFLFPKELTGREKDSAFVLENVQIISLSRLNTKKPFYKFSSDSKYFIEIKEKIFELTHPTFHIKLWNLKEHNLKLKVMLLDIAKDETDKIGGWLEKIKKIVDFK